MKHWELLHFLFCHSWECFRRSQTKKFGKHLVNSNFWQFHHHLRPADTLVALHHSFFYYQRTSEAYGVQDFQCFWRGLGGKFCLRMWHYRSFCTFISVIASIHLQWQSSLTDWSLGELRKTSKVDRKISFLSGILLSRIQKSPLSLYFWTFIPNDFFPQYEGSKLTLLIKTIKRFLIAKFSSEEGKSDFAHISATKLSVVVRFDFNVKKELFFLGALFDSAFIVVVSTQPKHLGML